MAATETPLDHAQRYAKDGYVGGVRIIDESTARQHREQLESVEAKLGTSLHYIDKAHTALRSPYELATHPMVLDTVEAMLGPDILLYNSTFIIKEPGAAAKVNWHQDLTYWGLADDDAQVSMWLALAPATAESGCMMMLPGSHTAGRIDHETGSDDGNLLLLGQHITDIDTSSAVHCTLEPGEASFHHGWTVHASQPNRSRDRRIGLNVQYLAAHNRMEAGAEATAMLVRGEDRHGNFGHDDLPGESLDLAAIDRWREADERMKANFKLDG
jgi:ectoine hydroxylase-related dioxygenase (phytanoyl-CoA dioxygenase family)